MWELNFNELSNSVTFVHSSIKMEVVQKHSVLIWCSKSLKKTHDMFLSDQPNSSLIDNNIEKAKMNLKSCDDCGQVMHMVGKKESYKMVIQNDKYDQESKMETDLSIISIPPRIDINHSVMEIIPEDSTNTSALVLTNIKPNITTSGGQSMLTQLGTGHLIPCKASLMPKPKWHPPWKLYQVISGHLGWVCCIDVELGNQWFVTRSADQVIKIWDLPSRKLNLSLSGHISNVHRVAVRHYQPYIFSCGEDKQVKC